MKQKLLPQLLHQLPISMQSKALRYQSELSAYNYVVGRLLLKQGLDSAGHDTDLEKIDFQKNGKPDLPGVQFNISHSDHQVICGFAGKGQIGVDIEKIKQIEFEAFTSTFTSKEWDIIKTAEDPLRSFYWFWTRKESIIKALGLSLNYLHQIELDVTLDYIMIDGGRWYLRNVDLGVGYVGAVCCKEEVDKIEVLEIKF